jgi:hypothetical protein
MRASWLEPSIIVGMPNLAWCRLAPPIDCSSVEMLTYCTISHQWMPFSGEQSLQTHDRLAFVVSVRP